MKEADWSPAPHAIVTASITNEAVDDLGLTVGQEGYAIIKASDVMIGIGG